MAATEGADVWDLGRLAKLVLTGSSVDGGEDLDEALEPEEEGVRDGSMDVEQSRM